jgi:hypothetical protein
MSRSVNGIERWIEGEREREGGGGRESERE